MSPNEYPTNTSILTATPSFIDKVLTRIGMISSANAVTAAENDASEPTQVRQTLRQAGYRASGNHNGMANALEVHLHRIFSALHEQFDQNDKQQEAARKQKQAEIDVIDTDIAHQKDEQKTVEARIEKRQQHTVEWQKEIYTLHREPGTMNLPEPSKVLMRIGLGLLVGISIYLFLFYSSAGYLAFFKSASAEDTEGEMVLNAIFEAKALEEALQSSLGALLLITALPTVFMRLGYLIHEFLIKKNGWPWLVAVLLVSLIFDAIIGFEITKRVYEAHRNIMIGGSEVPYSLALAITDVNMWLIIFAGFVVYVVWGGVFHFFMEAHHRNNKVGMALKERKELIAAAKREIQQWEEEISKLKLAVRDLMMQRHRLVAELAGVLIPSREWGNYLMEFCSGWLAWMAGAEQSYSKQTHCKERLDQFVAHHLGYDTVLSYRSSGLIPGADSPVSNVPPISPN